MDPNASNPEGKARNGLNVIKYAAAKLPLLIGAAACLLVIGEAQTRIPFIPQRLEYLPDRDIVGLFRPNQVGYDWIAQGSVRTPNTSINSDGHRGPETDWTQPVLLALGSSEAFGLGVADPEVWTQVLERSLHDDGREWEVANAAGMGFGAYHQVAVMERVLEQRTPQAVVVSLSIGERFFAPIPEDERDAKLAQSQSRQRIRKFTKFLPFLYRKLKSQLPGVKATSPAGPEVGEFMVDKDQTHWAGMLAAAQRISVPILFVVRDPWLYESSRVVEEALLELSASYPKASVIRIGPEPFGMEQYSPAARVLRYAEDFTLRIDPHANARQHEIIGNTVADVVASIIDEYQLPQDSESSQIVADAPQTRVGSNGASSAQAKAEPRD